MKVRIPKLARRWLASMLLLGLATTFARSESKFVHGWQRTHLAIDGPGMFLLRDAATSEASLTRSGRFSFDSSGYLVTDEGHRVQGFGFPSNETLGDVRLRYPDGVADEVIISYTIDESGQLLVVTTPWSSSRLLSWFRGQQPQSRPAVALWDLPKGAPRTTQIIGQLALVHFPEIEQATRLAGSWNKIQRYCVPTGIQEHLSQYQFRPSAPGVGKILAETLEFGTYAKLHLAHADASQATLPILAASRHATDLAIAGEGWFLLRDAVTNEKFVTRAGVFLKDENHFLVTPGGLRLQAYPREYPSDGTTNREPSTFQDLQLVSHYPPPWVSADPTRPKDFVIDQNGNVDLWFSDNTTWTTAKIELVQVQHPEALEAQGLGVFRVTPDAEILSEWPPTPSHRRGSIEGARLDLREIPPDLRERYRKLRYFTQGPIARFENPAHLAVAGEGLMLVRVPQNPELLATRSGCFSVSPEGFLELPTGHRLQGEMEDAANPDELVDLQISLPAAWTNSPRSSRDDLPPWQIDFEGNLTVGLPDGSWIRRGQIRLQTFGRPDALTVAATGICGEILHSAYPDLSRSYVSGAGEWDTGDALYGGYGQAFPQSHEGMRPGTENCGLVQSSALEFATGASGYSLPSLRGSRLLEVDLGMLPLDGDLFVEWSDDLETWHLVQLDQVQWGTSAAFLDFSSPELQGDASTAAHPNRFYRGRVVRYPDPPALTPSDPAGGP